MNPGLVRGVCVALIAGTLSWSIPAPVRADLIRSEEALGAGAAALDGARARVQAALDRDDVRRQLGALGVDPALARDRVEALTDAEAAQLAAELHRLPAGGSSFLGAVLFVFVLLLITDILGLTKIFPFTRPIR